MCSPLYSSDLLFVLQQRYVTRVLCVARRVCAPQANRHLYVNETNHAKRHQILHKDQSISIGLQLLVRQVLVHAERPSQIEVHVVLCQTEITRNMFSLIKMLQALRILLFTYHENGP